ncbi:CLUMA_CG007594, isoform A [Clunio marinus]|uniref:CLUMA_CG007594, isoform A n=1 Tax=Clunio marinus TaxID=568069 RepID=A0A1J1I143_9DIPT|nr:CLUMA_CG007594, isoform A [Clunio marinus]
MECGKLGLLYRRYLTLLGLVKMMDNAITDNRVSTTNRHVLNIDSMDSPNPKVLATNQLHSHTHNEREIDLKVSFGDPNKRKSKLLSSVKITAKLAPQTEKLISGNRLYERAKTFYAPKETTVKFTFTAGITEKILNDS